MRGWVRAALQCESGSAVRPPGQVSGPSDADLLGAVLRQRVVEIVHARAAEVGVPDDVAGQLGRVRDAGRSLVPLQLLELARVHDLLDSAGVRHLVFKGPALAVQTTGDLGARGFGDLDLLIDPGSVESVATLLLAHGYRSEAPLPAPGSWAWRRLVHASHELTFLGASTSVDLHWRLDPTFDALPAFADLFSRREVLDLGGTTTATLGRGDALAHACLNAAKDEWRWLRNLVDVHRLAGLDGAWELAGGRPLGRLEVRALAVTRAHVGLPATTPAAVLEQVDLLGPRRLAHLAAAAGRAQERPVRDLDDRPGTATSQVLRYQLAASTSPRDVRRLLGTLVLPGRVVREIDAPSAWVGVPTGLGRRVGLLARHAVGARHQRVHEPAGSRDGR